MSCAAQVFSPVSAEQIEAIRLKAAGAGLILDGTYGTAEHSGVKLDWIYDPMRQALTITCTGKPFIVGCGHVNQIVHDLIESCLGG